MNALYKIKLQNFEGPLDLLLFFVRKDELNIYDIPIARITKSYLEYLQLMQDLNLDIASEFILMAATLMRIKVRMMLPKDPVAEDEEEMMDPREELSRRLIEYRQFKEASRSLSELDAYWRQVYRRSYFNFDLLPQNEEEVIGVKDISFFDLLTAYKKALEKKPIPVFHNVERLNVTVEDQQKYIMDFFRDRNCYLFTELCEDMAKIEIVVTFLALLDLVKRAEISVKQASIFDDIWIYKASEFEGEMIPEEEKAETEIQELTEPVVPQTSIDEASLISMQPEPSEENTDVSDAIEVTKDEPTTIQEIKVEFVENEAQSIETDEHSASEWVESEAVPGISEFVPPSQTEQDYEPDTVDKMRPHPESLSENVILKSDTDNKTEDTQALPIIADVHDKMNEGTHRKEPVETEYKEQSNEPDEAELPDHVTVETSDVPEVPVTEEIQNPPIVENLNESGKTIEQESLKTITDQPEEKVSRWKTFIIRIVTIVRKIFSK